MMGLVGGLVVIAEYASRRNLVSALCLKNRCSKCHWKGHNASNCPDNAKWRHFTQQFGGTANEMVCDSVVGMAS